MPKQAVELSALEVRNLTTPGLHPVGVVPGLALQVSPSGARSWVLRVRVGGRRRDMGLGGFPAVTLAAAREKARAARDLIREGVDPVERQREAAMALRAASATAQTFEQCAAAYVKAHAAGWRNAKHRQQFENTLEQYAHPVIGSVYVRDVAVPHVLAILEPIWSAKTETAVRLRGRIEMVLDWAAARDYRSKDNPARWRGHLDKLLPRPSKVRKVEHHAAVAVADAGAFMARLRAAEGMGARALEFAILTAARSGEVRLATWAEVDVAAGLWTIPASRMKAGKEHRVPLSAEALALLEKVGRTAGSDYIFAAVRGGPLSDMTLSAVMRRMEVDAVPHGFRSTFRDWAAERTAYPNEVAEMALAHAIGDKVEAAYRRGDLFDKRRKIMADWATFLGRIEKKGDVIPIREKRA
jgi:integrase